jgi:hypothetical protein
MKTTTILTMTSGTSRVADGYGSAVVPRPDDAADGETDHERGVHASVQDNTRPVKLLESQLQALTWLRQMRANDEEIDRRQDSVHDMVHEEGLDCQFGNRCSAKELTQRQVAFESANAAPTMGPRVLPRPHENAPPLI